MKDSVKGERGIGRGNSEGMTGTINKQEDQIESRRLHLTGRSTGCPSGGRRERQSINSLLTVYS